MTQIGLRFTLHTQARRGGVTLNVSLAVGSEVALQDLCIFVDTNKIAQVVRNLVSNGLKFTPNGGTVDVTVSVIEDGMQATGGECERQWSRYISGASVWYLW